MGATLRRGARRPTPPAPHEPEAYDRVLVDPPCSDLGTLASRPDARWRKTADQPARLAAHAGRDPARGRGRAAPRRHARLLDLHDLAQPRTRASSTAFLADHADFEADDLRAERSPSGSIQPCPASCRRCRTATARTGFFIARLRRRGAP